MIKHLVTVALFAIGGAGVGLVGFLGANPMAFTHSIGKLPPLVVPALVPTATTVRAEVESPTFEVAEVRITRPRHVAPKERVLPARLEPCSEWGDVGAVAADRVAAIGARRIRHLCKGIDGQR